MKPRGCTMLERLVNLSLAFFLVVLAAAAFKSLLLKSGTQCHLTPGKEGEERTVVWVDGNWVEQVTVVDPWTGEAK